MNEKDLIRKIKELKSVKPRKDWVVLTKSRIIGEDEPSFSPFSFLSFLFLNRKLVFVPIVALLVVIGLFGFAQYNAIPGDPLFSAKKVIENIQVGLSSPAEKPQLRLELANKRLEELNQIAQQNQVKNLSPAIEEFQTNVSAAAKDLAALNVNVTSSDPAILKALVNETQKLQENKNKLEKVLGTKVGDTQNLENSLTILEKNTAAQLIADLENRSLSEEDQTLLEKAKGYFDSGDYSSALENLWLLSNNK